MRESACIKRLPEGRRRKTFRPPTSRRGAPVPRVVSATTPAFGCAAAQSIAHLRFTMPRKNGEPVDVVVRVPMTFQHRPAS